MNTKRLALLVSAGVAATGCGVSSAVVRSNHAAVLERTTPLKSTASVAHAAFAPSPAAIASAAPSPPAIASAAPAPWASPVIVAADETNPANPATFEVALLATTGAVVSTAMVPSNARWTVGAGGGDAYWVTSGNLQRLDRKGHVTTVAAVPATEAGRVVVSPDGSQWAYATTSTDTRGVVTNRLYRGQPGQPAQLIAQRTADPRYPRADAPPTWQYYLISWTAAGILIERQPLGGCGCGTPFDMQMSAGYAAFVDPASGASTPLPVSPSCPLSGAGVSGSVACFDASASGASTGLTIGGASTTTHTYPLSGRNDGGDAVFGGATLTYATVPNTAGGCGAADWRPQTTLRVMDIATGDARALGPPGLAPVAWLPGGAILATLSVAHSNTTTSSIVTVDPSTGSYHTLFDRSFDIVGIA